LFAPAAADLTGSETDPAKFRSQFIDRFNTIFKSVMVDAL